MPAEEGNQEIADAPQSCEDAGKLLRQAREAAGVAIEQVSEALHLDESVVVLLEESRFEELGAPVFVRGHLKAYARYLKQPEAEILAAYGEEATESPIPPQQRVAKKSDTGLNPLAWATGFLAILLTAGLAYFVFQDDPATLVQPVESSAPVPSVAVSPVIRGTTQSGAPAALPAAVAGGGDPHSASNAERAQERPVPQEDPATAVAASVDEPVADLLVPPVVESDPRDLPVAGPESSQVTLELYFRAESWAEISDRSRRILFGLQREGVRRELQGEPPFSLLLGNAPAVDIFVDGEPYELPPGNTTGRVARLTIGDAGQVNP